MSKHWSVKWRRRLYVAATLAAGMVLLAAPAWGKYHWVPTP